MRRGHRRGAAPPPRDAARGPASAGFGGSSDPLAGVERVLIDGSNLAYALGRGPMSASAGAAGAAGTPRPAAGILASVRVAFPPTVRVELVFDGEGSVGIARAGTSARAAQNLYVEHSGRRSADRVIEASVEAQLKADGPAGTWGILVVTDDRELRGIVQARGARVAGTAWLAGRLARAATGAGAGPGASSLPRSGTSIGHRRPPRPPRDRNQDRC